MISSAITAIVIVSLILSLIKFKHIGTRSEKEGKKNHVVNEFTRWGEAIIEGDKRYKAFLKECINSGFNMNEFDDVHDNYHKMSLQYEVLKGYYISEILPLHREEYRNKKDLYSKDEQKVIDLVYYNISMIYHLLDICIDIHDKNIKLSKEYRKELSHKLELLENSMEELKKVINKISFADMGSLDSKYSIAHK